MLLQKDMVTAPYFAGHSGFMVDNQSILIDLSFWYKDSLVPKIELIRTSIDRCRELVCVGMVQRTARWQTFISGRLY